MEYNEFIKSVKKVNNKATNKIKNEFNLQFRIRLNKVLYEDKVISLEVYQKMENYLISKLAKLKTIKEGVS